MRSIANIYAAGMIATAITIHQLDKEPMKKFVGVVVWPIVAVLVVPIVLFGDDDS